MVPAYFSRGRPRTAADTSALQQRGFLACGGAVVVALLLCWGCCGRKRQLKANGRKDKATKYAMHEQSTYGFSDPSSDSISSGQAKVRGKGGAGSRGGKGQAEEEYEAMQEIDERMERQQQRQLRRRQKHIKKTGLI
jgi:hypothetical protein